MKIIAMGDEAISRAIGAQIEAIRLKRNLHQDYVAHEAGISRETYRKIAIGKGTLINIIAVLRSLDELERLSSMIQDVPNSPIQLAKLAGRKRLRASKARGKPAALLGEGKTGTGKPTLIDRTGIKKETRW